MAVLQKTVAERAEMSTTKISRLLSGENDFKEKDVHDLAAALSEFSYKSLSGVLSLSAEYIFEFLLEGSDPDKRFVEKLMQRRLQRVTLLESQIFASAQSALFEEVPVALAPSHVFFENLDPFWTFHEDKGGKTNKVQVSILANPEPLLSVDDVLNISRTVVSDTDLSNSEKNEIVESVGRITEKSNPYLRLRSLEIEELDRKSETLVLTLRCEPSDYQVGALAAILDRLGRATTRLSQKLVGKNVHNLAVRVALVSVSPNAASQREKGIVDRRRRIILHRRTRRVFTFRHAWDVSAAGYIDRQNHLAEHDERRIDVSKAARAEINEELGVPTFLLPTEEHFDFFGLTQNTETKQTDIVGQMHVDDLRFDQIWKAKRPNSDEVDDVVQVPLTPEAIGRFLGQDEMRIVPSALATIVLCLRHAGFPAAEIVSELRSVVENIHSNNGFAAYDSRAN